MCWRIAWARSRKRWNRDDRSGENGSGKHRLIEWQVKRIRRLRRELGVAITARDIPKRQLRQLAVRIHGCLRLFLRGLGLLLTPGFDTRFVVRSQDFRTTQVFFGVNVLGFLRLFASAFLACRFGDILRSLLGDSGAALRRTGKQAGTKQDGEPAAQRRAQRNPPVYMRLDTAGDVSACHFPTKAGGHPMAKYYCKPAAGAIGIF
jgi:hypothetical protein